MLFCICEVGSFCKRLSSCSSLPAPSRLFHATANQLDLFVCGVFLGCTTPHKPCGQRSQGTLSVVQSTPCLLSTAKQNAPVHLQHLQRSPHLTHLTDQHATFAASLKDVLEKTDPLDKVSSAGEYDAIYVPGGHGTAMDLPENSHLQKLVRSKTSSNAFCCVVSFFLFTFGVHKPFCCAAGSVLLCRVCLGMLVAAHVFADEAVRAHR